MIEQNNPASRLYDILTRLNQSSIGMTTSAVLSDVFEVQNEPFSLMHALVGFQQLTDEVVKYATQTRLPIKPLERHLPQIKSVAAITNLDAGWGNYRSRITSEMLVVLEMIAHSEEDGQEEAIPVKSLNDLSYELDELFQLVENSTDVDKELRLFILRQVELIRRAISEYRISGAKGFSAYLEGLIFDTAKKKELLKKAQDSKSSIFEKFKGVVGQVGGFAKHASEDIKAIEEVASSGKNLLELFSN